MGIIVKTLVEAVAALGKRAVMYTADGFGYYVKVEDVKTAYGNIRFLVKSEVGGAEKWVNADGVHVMQDSVVNVISHVKAMILGN